MTRGLVVAIAYLAACKSVGTIDLEFDLHTCNGIDAGTGAYVVIYGQRDTQCVDCVCGGCFERGSSSAVACADHCSPDMLAAGVPLGLSPGQWVVIVGLYTGADVLFASQCQDVTVDRDGTAGNTFAATTCAATCPPTGSSPSSP